MQDRPFRRCSRCLFLLGRSPPIICSSICGGGTVRGGFPEIPSESLVLFGERDSIYSRPLSRRSWPADGSCKGKYVKVEFYPYLRGLDGAGLDGASKQVRLVRAGDKPASERKDLQIEWPEGRDQRDYVRRSSRKSRIRPPRTRTKPK